MLKDMEPIVKDVRGEEVGGESVEVVASGGCNSRPVLSLGEGGIRSRFWGNWGLDGCKPGWLDGRIGRAKCRVGWDDK